MRDLTAKRTLVKSPPELWSELSEVERLARHLGAFGEITITKLEPEHTVAWEGEGASGTVSIEPSGWGTKVTLTAQVEGEAPGGGAAAVGDAAAENDGIEEPVAEEPVAEEPAEPLQPQESAEAFEAEEPAERVEAEPPRKRAFLSWLFRPRTSGRAAASATDGKPSEPIVEPVLDEAPEVESERVIEQEPEAEAEPMVEVASEPMVEAAAEPEVQPEPPAEGEHGHRDAVLDRERAQAILDDVLDALGSAHHRPFSRG
ncbi:MAG: hypothetical protein ACRDN8_02725 [Thermoleophilaceae bacterium]